MLRLHLPPALSIYLSMIFVVFFSGIVGGYGVCVYISYGHCAISLWAFGNGPVQNHRETTQRLCGHHAVFTALHRNRTDIVQRLCSFSTEDVWWLCDYRVVLGIHVPNMYNFSFLIEMTPKTEGRKGMRSKKVQDDLSQGGRMVMVRSP